MTEDQLAEIEARCAAFIAPIDGDAALLAYEQSRRQAAYDRADLLAEVRRLREVLRRFGELVAGYEEEDT